MGGGGSWHKASVSDCFGGGGGGAVGVQTRGVAPPPPICFGYAALQVLIFVETKRGCDQLARELTQERLDAHSLHGDKAQCDRDRTLRQFREDPHGILVATDVAARGLDIRDIEVCVHGRGDSFASAPVARTAVPHAAEWRGECAGEGRASGMMSLKVLARR